MKKAIITARDLCKSYAHNGVQNHVINGMDLDIYEGDFTVIMGASGSGKSTTLYMLSGMDKATSGTIMFDGRDLTKMKEKELTALRHGRFGFVFQQMHLIGNLSVFENITVPGYLNKETSAEETDKRADELIRLMGIEHIKTHLPSQCSGGEQQRCAIARAAINDPDILFADEPTGALNKHNTIEVLNLLTELNKRGQSILMVTHDARAAQRANRIIYIEDGKAIGDLELAPYESGEDTSRETQINSWLSSMGW